MKWIHTFTHKTYNIYLDLLHLFLFVPAGTYCCCHTSTTNWVLGNLLHLGPRLVWLFNLRHEWILPIVRGHPLFLFPFPWIFQSKAYMVMFLRLTQGVPNPSSIHCNILGIEEFLGGFSRGLILLRFSRQLYLSHTSICKSVKFDAVRVSQTPGFSAIYYDNRFCIWVDRSDFVVKGEWFMVEDSGHNILC